MRDDVKIIVWRRNDFFIKDILDCGYEIESAYKFDKSWVISAIRVLLFKTKLPLKRFWFNNQLKDFQGTYIIFDAMICLDFLKWLKLNNPNSNIHFWYWNKVTANKVQPSEINLCGIKPWTFNLNDSEKFNIALNHSFFYKDIYRDSYMKKVKPEYDFSFIGRDKGRRKRIYELLNLPECKNLKPFLYFIGDHVYESFKSKDYKKKCLSYQKTLEVQANSKAILEFVPGGSAGLTLRTMDAMCQKVKLITDNKRISETSLYNKDNIFILGVDNLNDLKNFLKKDYTQLDENIISYYSMENWVNRFCE